MMRLLRVTGGLLVLAGLLALGCAALLGDYGANEQPQKDGGGE